MLTDPFKQKFQKKPKNFNHKKLIRKVSILDSFEHERKTRYKNKSINLINKNKDLCIKNTNLIASDIKQNSNKHYRSNTNNITISNETDKIKTNLTEFIAKKNVINLSSINLKMVHNFPHLKEKMNNEINSLTTNKNSLMAKKRRIISKELNTISNNKNCKSNDDYNNYFEFSKIMNKMSFSIPVIKRRNRLNNNFILLYNTTILKTRENLLTKIILEIDKKQLLKHYFNNWVNKYNSSSTIKLDKISYFFNETKKNNGFLSLGDYLRISDIFAKRKNKKIILSIIGKKDKNKKPLFKNHTYFDTYKQSYQKNKKLGNNYIKIDLNKRTNNKTVI